MTDETKTTNTNDTTNAAETTDAGGVRNKEGTRPGTTNPGGPSGTMVTGTADDQHAGGFTTPEGFTHVDTYHSINDGEQRNYEVEKLAGYKVVIDNPVTSGISVAFDQRDENSGLIRVRAIADHAIQLHLFRRDDAKEKTVTFKLLAAHGQ